MHVFPGSSSQGLPRMIGISPNLGGSYVVLIMLKDLTEVQSDNLLPCLQVLHIEEYSFSFQSKEFICSWHDRRVLRLLSDFPINSKPWP